MIHIRVTTAPASEPVTLTEAKAHLRVDFSDDDTLITTLITSARRCVEAYIGRKIITQEVTIEIDERDIDSPLYIPVPPTQEVTDFNYWNTTTEAWTAIGTDNWQLIGTDGDGPARLLEIGDGWTREREYAALQLIVSAGYGIASEVPEDIKHGILYTIADLYENRESFVAGMTGQASNVERLPVDAMAVLQPYRYGYL